MTFDGAVTVGEASRLTGYNPEYLRRLLRKGAIESRRIGTNYLVNPDSLMAYVREQQADGRGPQGSTE